jgi:hypothetical protein
MLTASNLKNVVAAAFAGLFVGFQTGSILGGALGVAVAIFMICFRSCKCIEYSWWSRLEFWANVGLCLVMAANVWLEIVYPTMTWFTDAFIGGFLGCIVADFICTIGAGIIRRLRS